VSTEPANLLSQWARVLIGSLARAGVREVVASPGSRSTPFLCAALDCEQLSVRTIVDERSAAFFALGQSKLTGSPSLLLCTSGTAAANYLPAVIEASESSTPLIVLSADRPFELHGCRAPQTIDQTRLYGGFARSFLDLGAPCQALEALSRRAVQAVLAARSPQPGPVQIDARAAKPLEPIAAMSDAERTLEQRADQLLRRVTRAHAPRLMPDPEALAGLARACSSTERGLVVCGPLPAWGARVPAAALARALGFPLLCEATSQLRFALQVRDETLFDAADAVLESAEFRHAHPPELVLRIGAPPVSDSFGRYLAEHPAARLHVIAEHGLPDPDNRAESVVLGAPADSVQALLEQVSPRRTRSAWLGSFADANAAAWRRSETELASEAGASAAARAAIDRMPDGACLVIGNSSPLRLLERHCRARAGDASVISQRGASGIDGLVSCAAGVATARARPTLLLIGDISFLHDLGGLWAARQARAPLVIVVLNNRGGRIFEQLPIAQALRGSDQLRHWTTPQDFDLSHAAALYGHAYERTRDAASLRAALDRAWSRSGTSVIDATVGDSS
jgi:2-succinyl-5-enolpyruvyl-6-hydroxy-3-cyclohexene-1-carboxylate synthase